MFHKAVGECTKHLNLNFELKEKQIEALSAFYDNKDVLVSLKTGYGKSLIYQLTPFLSSYKASGLKNLDKITIVIAPLNSIMKNQILSLYKKNIPSCYLDMSMSSGESYKLQESSEVDEDEDNDDSTAKDDFLSCSVPLDEVFSGKYRLVYAHPEAFLSTKKGLKYLQDKSFVSKVCCVAIDEAHMIQEW